MRSRHADTRRSRRANGHESEHPPLRRDSPKSSTAKGLGNLIAWRRRGNHKDRAHQPAVSLYHRCFGALHEHLNDTDCKRREENDRAR
jgi:hypothetical protein